MNYSIQLPASVFRRLQVLAVPFEDTPVSVIERLLDHYEEHALDKSEVISVKDLVHMESKYNNSSESANRIPALEKRLPRQRGVEVVIDNERMVATSLGELYEMVLRFLDKKGCLDKIGPRLPISTSSSRYLIATTPVHPNGNEFVRPIQYRDYYMESHKDYRNGLNHLRKLLDLCGLELKYVR